jgi:hypothetical protein
MFLVSSAFVRIFKVFYDWDKKKIKEDEKNK